MWIVLILSLNTANSTHRPSAYKMKVLQHINLLNSRFILNLIDSFINFYLIQQFILFFHLVFYFCIDVVLLWLLCWFILCESGENDVPVYQKGLRPPILQRLRLLLQRWERWSGWTCRWNRPVIKYINAILLFCNIIIITKLGAFLFKIQLLPYIL